MTPHERAAEARSLVDGLSIADPRISDAMREVPRHRFVPVSEEKDAYVDAPLPLGVPGATISAPSMVALQLEAASLRPGDRVLEVGAGMGYLLALAGELTDPDGEVHGVEIDPMLALEARRRLAVHRSARNVHVHPGDGFDGWAGGAPYDRILVSCQTEEIAPAWRDQLAPQGRIVAPVGDSDAQILTTWGRSGSGWTVQRGTPCRFVALRRRLRRDI